MASDTFDAWANNGGPGFNDFTIGFGEPMSTKQEIKAATDLDGEEARRELAALLNWFYWERTQQSVNRMEMALDADFYDGLQWRAEDAQALRNRGQMPLVFNEIAPVIDWLIGTQRRSSVDWKVLPRTEQGVQLADIKTKLLKYVSDVNKVQFARSRAFADAIKVGVGWLDDGVRDDETQDALYSKYESWRYVIWDSRSRELDLGDETRYIFRWRWVDLDVALAMFPDRQQQIQQAAWQGPRTMLGSEDSEDMNEGLLYGEQMVATATLDERAGVLFAAGTAPIGGTRRLRVRLIECQYRKPTKSQVVKGGTFHGAHYHESDTALVEAVQREGASVVDKITMRVHFAVFTEAAMLAWGPSRYRHNRFTLTPVWAYKRDRDQMPYGLIRRLKDIQEDMNKRASKALFLLNTNQLVADEGAVEDLDVARDELDRPDGVILKKPGKDFEIRRDQGQATGQIDMMTMDAQAIQRHSGVSNENLGRQTNAQSGVAIEARQTAGSIVTTELFDNLRFATQIQGEKQLSLIEQYYTQQQVVRLAGRAAGQIEWLKVNQPQLQPDGSWRWLNDITAEAADFVVSDQDYAGTMRQVMFDTLAQMAQRLPPEVSLRVLTIALQYSDLPNNDDIAREIRQITGEQDPNAQLTPEQQQQLAQQQAQAQQQQQEALMLQRQTAIAALQEQQAKVRQLNAQAAMVEAQAQQLGAGAGDQVQQAVMQVKQQADAEIERLQMQLAQAAGEAANKTQQIQADADTKLQVAKIQADAEIRVAEITRASDANIQAMVERIKALEGAVTTAGIDVPTSLADAQQPASSSTSSTAQAKDGSPSQPSKG